MIMHHRLSPKDCVTKWSTRICYSWLKACALLAVGYFSLTVTSAQAQLQHRWSFDTDATDSVGSADWTLEGNAMVTGGALVLDGSGTLADGNATRASQLGSNININTYPAVTLELWATPSTANTGFTTVAGFSQDNDTDADGVSNVPIDPFILQTHRGDNVSRTSISLGSDGDPWTEEDGANGTELNDNAEHQYVSVLTNQDISLYIDGVLQAVNPVGTANGGNAANNMISGLVANNTPAAGTALGDYMAWIGYAYGVDPLWIGSVNEYRLFNDAASANYVNRSFKAGPDTLVSFPPEFDLTMFVNQNTGATTIQNTSSDPVTFNYYLAESEGGALNTTGWNSLSDQGLGANRPEDLDGSGIVDSGDITTWEGGFASDATGDTDNDGDSDGVDFLRIQSAFGSSGGPGFGWEEAGGSDANHLAELNLKGTTTLAPDEVLNLGDLYSTGGAHDITFQYAVPGGLLLTEGLVQYVTSLSATAAVPEPATILGVASAMLLVMCRRQRRGGMSEMRSEGGL